MKTRSLIFAFFGMLAIFFASCDDPIEITGMTMESDTLEVAVDAAIELILNLEPADAEGPIAWISSDPTIAAVSNGIVTGLKVGQVTVAASSGVYSANSVVNVTPKPLDPSTVPASLKGSNYYLIQLDATSFTFLGDKVVADFRPLEEDPSTNLWVWENTFAAGSPTGLNMAGQAEGWVSLVVGSVGWSGAGFNVGADFGDIDMTDIYNNPDDYVFHVALKSAQASSSVQFIFNDGTAEAKVTVGTIAIEGLAPYVDYTRDNEWQIVEIPVTYLNSLGIFYNETFSDVNVLAFLCGGVGGVTLDLDAAFFYKPAAE
jgi:hypothetical protein